MIVIVSLAVVLMLIQNTSTVLSMHNTNETDLSFDGFEYIQIVLV